MVQLPVVTSNEVVVEVPSVSVDIEVVGPPGPPGSGLGQAEADLLYVNISGDAMTGPLDGVTPTLPAHLVRKDYVDARTPKITVSTTAPSNPNVGDVWIDTN